MTLDPPSAAAIETTDGRPDEQDWPAKAEREDEDTFAALLADTTTLSTEEESSDASSDSPSDVVTPADTGQAVDDIFLQDADAEPEGDEAPEDAESPFDDALLQDSDAAPAAAPDQADTPEDTESLFDDAQLQDVEAAPTAAPDQADAPEDTESLFDDTQLQNVEAAPTAASDQADAPEDAESLFDDTQLQDVEAAPTAAPDQADAPEDTDLSLDDALLEDIDAAPAASSDQADLTSDTGLASDDALLHSFNAAPDASIFEDDAPTLEVESVFGDPLLGDAAASPADPGAFEYEDAHIEAIPAGPAAALAFATDPETEVALRDGLSGFEGSSPDCGEAQVWQGNLRAAIAALAAGHAAPLVFVDIDGVPYPAGAIHELAAVCDMGTVVIAVGSDGSARPGRELLLAGVSDYLAKPLTAATVRAAALRAETERDGADEVDTRPSGCAAGFIGNGGSGTTTLAAAVAIHAAARGCYVAVLDLSRTVAATAFSLGVEPVAGLDQLLESAESVIPEPEMIDGVRVRRSDRIEVYAHRWSAIQPAVPPTESVNRLIAGLKRRSKLVLVDGFDTLEMRTAPPSEIDTRVFVAEPTTGRSAHAARMMQMLGADHPLLFVQNHTRAFKRDIGLSLLRNAGIETEPDVVFPFEASLPDTADRGWPQDRLPRSLRAPMTTLTDRLLASLAGGAPSSLLLSQET